MLCGQDAEIPRQTAGFAGRVTLFSECANICRQVGNSADFFLNGRPYRYRGRLVSKYTKSRQLARNRGLSTAFRLSKEHFTLCKRHYGLVDQISRHILACMGRLKYTIEALVCPLQEIQ
jgi:hypothetical protein